MGHPYGAAPVLRRLRHPQLLHPTIQPRRGGYLGHLYGLALADVCRSRSTTVPREGGHSNLAIIITVHSPDGRRRRWGKAAPSRDGHSLRRRALGAVAHGHGDRGRVQEQAAQHRPRGRRHAAQQATQLFASAGGGGASRDGHRRGGSRHRRAVAHETTVTTHTTRGKQATTQRPAPVLAFARPSDRHSRIVSDLFAIIVQVHSLTHKYTLPHLRKRRRPKNPPAA